MTIVPIIFTICNKIVVKKIGSRETITDDYNFSRYSIQHALVHKRIIEQS